MKNSDIRAKVARIVEEVLSLTGEDHLQHLITAPIEHAAAEFSLNDNGAVTHERFVAVITDFVRHVYRCAALGGQELSKEKAGAEALALLQEGYQGAHSSGYYAAYLDATSQKDEQGIEQVLRQMGSIIINRVRHGHIAWVWASRLELQDRPVRREIAEYVLNRWADVLPPELKQCSPAILAGQLPEIISLIISADKAVKKILSEDQFKDIF